MITSCEEDLIVNKVDQSVINSTSFATSDYYVVNNPNSLGAIYLSNAQQWKVGDKIRITGSIRFKRSSDAAYVTNAYASSCDIKYVTEHAIYVGYNYSGITLPEDKTAQTHIELNQGMIELLRTLPQHGG